MQATSSRAARATSPSASRDRAAMVLMLVASIGAVFAFAGAVSTVLDADSGVVVVETWRMLGYLVFAGLFFLLAFRPRSYAGIWELALLHKGSMAIAATLLARGDASDAGAVAAFDGVLFAIILAAYLLSRGFTSWQRW